MKRRKKRKSKRKPRNPQVFYTNRNNLLVLLRNTDYYQKWRREVLQEQGRKCQLCGSNKNIQVHHIKGLAEITNEFIYQYGEFEPVEELLDIVEFHVDFWDVDNGIVLCDFCHQMEHPERQLWI